MTVPTLVLTGADVRAVLPPADCIAAVEQAFLRHAAGASVAPPALGIPVSGGGFHAKAAALELSRWYFAGKLNGNFPGNRAKYGLPTIQGVIVLADAENGRVLALMDSMEITRIRTGAATAVAARYLARPDSSTCTLFGCGLQGPIQLECLSSVLPLARVFAHDPNPEAAQRLARWARESLGVEAVVVDAASAAHWARESDVIVTCTPSRVAFLGPGAVRPGTFVAGVGADDAAKSELEPALLATSTVVVDVLAQCVAIGDLHHAIVAGVMVAGDVHAELAEVVSGKKRGRSGSEEITVFDSTGTAIEDVAAAALAYERALGSGRGVPVNLSGGGGD